MRPLVDFIAALRIFQLPEFLSALPHWRLSMLKVQGRDITA